MEKTIIINYANGTGDKPFQDFVKDEYEVLESETSDKISYFIIRDKKPN
jgi:hypothetical protein